MAHDYLGHNYYHRPSPYVGDASEEGALVHDERAADPARERGEVAEEQARRPPRALSSKRAPRVEASAARPPFQAYALGGGQRRLDVARQRDPQDVACI